MKNLNTAQIRETFLKHYQDNGHTRVASSSLVPINDPTLLFTSAGMVQFKDVFTGNEKRAYTRATTAQKCLRAGGKHNDLENVGFTGRHHTFFEMLGNFSFGDYFKQEAIRLAWDLITNKLGLPKDRLYVTVFREDDEAFDIWHKQEGVPKDRILRFNEADNFWSAGDVGPCGPCTEIYYDQGEAFNTGDPNKDRMGGDGDRYLEFYNLVFMQFNRDAGGNLSPLPKPSVDTGLGLERMAAILQGARNNYEADGFKTIFSAIEALSGQKYEGGMKENSVAMRVVADHLRATSFLIADGVLPSNEGRGYVLRRILRRAVRYGKKLGFTGPFLTKLVPALAQDMGEAYPELKTKQAFIQTALKAEEEKFFDTLEKGLNILSDALQKVAPNAALSGATAFLLYDSFGFPLDLTRVIAKEHGKNVDEAGFETAMEKQREQSRAAQDDGHAGAASDPKYLKLVEQKNFTQFTGYESCQGDGKLLAFLPAANGQDFEAIFDRSPFYAESGGQMGDSGAIYQGTTLLARVHDVRKPLPELTVIRGKLEPSQQLKIGQQYQQNVDSQLRAQTAANHTATHLLHWALREVLGTHVKQAGSLVNADLLRFDFTHFQALTSEELKKVEALISQKISAGNPVATTLMSKDAAIAAGAMALFGEKYDSDVRVVKVGDFSSELCGGTHVQTAAQIRLFVLASETGIAAGVRRIVAYTGEGALKYFQEKMQILADVKASLKVTGDNEITKKLERVLIREKDLEKKLAQVEADNAGSVAKELVAKAIDKAGIRYVVHNAGSTSVEQLRLLAERIRDSLPQGVIGIGGFDENKAYLIVGVSQDLTSKLQAGKIIQAIAPHIEGKGGGKPELAQAGGPKKSGLDAALKEIFNFA
jgi:alanyl-tRNA synthetase